MELALLKLTRFHIQAHCQCIIIYKNAITDKLMF